MSYMIVVSSTYVVFAFLEASELATRPVGGKARWVALDTCCDLCCRGFLPAICGWNSGKAGDDKDARDPFRGPDHPNGSSDVRSETFQYLKNDKPIVRCQIDVIGAVAIWTTSVNQGLDDCVVPVFAYLPEPVIISISVCCPDEKCNLLLNEEPHGRIAGKLYDLLHGCVSTAVRCT